MLWYHVIIPKHSGTDLLIWLVRPERTQLLKKTKNIIHTLWPSNDVIAQCACSPLCLFAYWYGSITVPNTFGENISQIDAIFMKK